MKITKSEIIFWVSTIAIPAIMLLVAFKLVQVGNEAAAYIEQHGIRGVVDVVWCGKEHPGCLSK